MQTEERKRGRPGNEARIQPWLALFLGSPSRYCRENLGMMLIQSLQGFGKGGVRGTRANVQYHIKGLRATELALFPGLTENKDAARVCVIVLLSYAFTH